MAHAQRRATTLILAVVCLVSAARLAESATPTINDEWNVSGQHSTRGRYYGHLEIDTDASGKVHLSETLVFSKGDPIVWQATGTISGHTIKFEAPAAIGIVGALEEKKDLGLSYHGTYTVNRGGGRFLKGSWKNDEDGTSVDEWASRAPSTGRVTLILEDGDRKDVPRNRMMKDGVALAPDVHENDVPLALPFRIKLKEPLSSDKLQKLVLDFPESKIHVFADATAKTQLHPGPLDSSFTEKTFYMTGVSPSAAGGGELLRVRIEQVGTAIDHDSGKVTVAQPAFLVIGHGNAGSYALDEYASEHKLDGRTNPTLVMGKTESGKPTPWAVYVFETQKGAKVALSTEGSVVAYDGHSNFGLGFAFGVTSAGFKTLHEFMLISDPQVAVNWVYLREEQGHPNLMFAESEYGDDASTTDFSDPVAVPRTIAGSKGDYNNMRTVRFPLSGGGDKEGSTRLHLERGTERWQDSHNAIDGARIVLKSGAPDMPAKKWSKLMLNSCYSGPYYFDSFGGRGTLFFTLEESSSGRTSAEFIEGCIEGKPNDTILSAVNAEENIWDYHVFGQ